MPKPDYTAKKKPTFTLEQQRYLLDRIGNTLNGPYLRLQMSMEANVLSPDDVNVTLDGIQQAITIIRELR